MCRAGEDKAVRFGKSDTSNNQYGRSRRLACFNGAMRLRRILESVGLIDFYPHGAALDHFEQIMGRGKEFGSRARIRREGWTGYE